MTTGMIVMIPVTISLKEGEETVWGYVPAEVVGIKNGCYECREVESEKIWLVPIELAADED